MTKTPPPYIPGMNYCHLFPKPVQPAFMKRKQTYAEYVATFKPYVPSPAMEKWGHFCGTVGVVLLAFVVLVTIAVLIHFGV